MWTIPAEFIVAVAVVWAIVQTVRRRSAEAKSRKLESDNASLADRWLNKG